MKKIIKNVDEKRGIHQVTIADERWYMKPVENPVSGIPEFTYVPSVTWIAQSYPKGIGYFKWLAEKGWDEAEGIKQTAGDKGTKVHLAIEDVINGKEVRIDSKYPNKSSGQMEELTLEECDAILSFIAWRKEQCLVQNLATEITVFSVKHNYAGTVDWIVRIDDSFWIIDFKTSQFVWPSHEIQLNAYKKSIVNGENVIEGFPEGYDLSKIRMAILQVGYKKNKFGFKFTEIADDFDLFLTTQKIWKREHGGEMPNKREYPIVLSPEVKKEVDQKVESAVVDTQKAFETTVATPEKVEIVSENIGIDWGHQDGDTSVEL